MIKQRRGRPPKPPDEVRTVRVTVLLTEREHATLLRACGRRGVATMLREAGLREASEKAGVDAGLMTKSPGVDGRAVRMHLEIEIACEHFDRTLPGAMDGHVWRVHPAHRSESERYARDVARHARDRARERCEDGDFWTSGEDKAARRYVSEMKTIDAMKRALESMERVDRMRGSGVEGRTVREVAIMALADELDPHEKRRRDRALVEAGVYAATGGACGLDDAEADTMIARVDAALKRGAA